MAGRPVGRCVRSLLVPEVVRGRSLKKLAAAPVDPDPEPDALSSFINGGGWKRKGDEPPPPPAPGDVFLAAEPACPLLEGRSHRPAREAGAGTGARSPSRVARGVRNMSPRALKPLELLSLPEDEKGRSFSTWWWV